MKKLKLIFFILLLCLIFTSCNEEHTCSEYSSDWISEEAITCEKEVTQIKKCTKCDKTIETRKYTQKHVLKEDIIQETSCTKEGIKKVTCELCDYEETITTPQNDHKITETIIQELTCTEDGITKYTCENCDYEETKTITKTGHTIKEEIVQELTCTEDGITKYTCENCDYEETKTITKTGHTIKEEIVQELTCTEDGIAKYTCENCDYEETKTITKTGHTIKEEIVQELTCTEDGIAKYTCENCDYEETKTITKTGHTIKEEIVQELTCTEDGITKYTCENCDYEETKTNKALGHTEEILPSKEATCNKFGLTEGKKCSTCNEILVKQNSLPKKDHDYVEEVLQVLTCTRDGITNKVCTICSDTIRSVEKATGHKMGNPTVVIYPTSTTQGKREFKCENCYTVMLTQNYVDNGYFENGKLSVNGRDLVNQYGQKFQLYGLSTHGIQWFGRYANLNTIASIQEGFTNNIIRFAMYTAEDGYCDGSASRKKQMLEDLYEGIDAATKLGLYVIVDWHMVGAESVADKNPLTYLNESKEFFSMVSEKYKYQNNILYEIMNEPNGSTTWADCKKYAEAVIPCIRKNTDAIVLVGNPKWTADLNSVMKDPLVGFTNIMYTYHFYAADHTNTSQVVKAYDSGFPVFISEFGFMESSGDGAISETNGNKWKQVLDSRNISYVAWNISNSKGAASIFKYNSSDMTSVADSNLKVWGVYLKNWYRTKSLTEKIPEQEEEETLQANVELSTEIPEWTNKYECFIVSLGDDESRLNYEWSTTNSSILTISEYSTLNILGNGKCSIIAKHKTNGSVGILDVELKDGKVVSYTSRYTD